MEKKPRYHTYFSIELGKIFKFNLFPKPKFGFSSIEIIDSLFQEVEANAKTFEPTEETEKKPRSGSPLPWENSMVHMQKKTYIFQNYFWSSF